MPLLVLADPLLLFCSPYMVIPIPQTPFPTARSPHHECSQHRAGVASLLLYMSRLNALTVNIPYMWYSYWQLVPAAESAAVVSFTYVLINK